jgi:hypothetical protein
MADEDYTSSLQIILALLAIVVTPVLLAVFYEFFGVVTLTYYHQKFGKVQILDRCYSMT